MSQRSTHARQNPSLEAVLAAVHDEDCRTIVRELSAPMTATEIASATGIPLSTTYKKLDLLLDATLIDEGLEIRDDGQHASQYAPATDEIRLTLSDDLNFEVTVF